MLDIFPVYSKGLENERKVRVWLPKDYSHSGKRYPVLYMHDGQNVFNDNAAIGGLSLGLEQHLEERNPQVIIVGIDQNSQDRINEYCPWTNGEFSKKFLKEGGPPGGKGKQYAEFVVNEIKPLIDSRFRTRPDHTSMGGISLGGLISLYIACKNPGLLKSIFIMSSGFYRNQEEIEKLVRESSLEGLESVYMDCGTRELGNQEHLNEVFFESNLAIYQLLKDKVPLAKFGAIKDAEHHYQFFRERLSKLFTFLSE